MEDPTKNIESLASGEDTIQIGNEVNKESTTSLFHTENVETQKVHDLKKAEFLSNQSVENEKTGKFIWLIIGFVLTTAIILGAVFVFQDKSLEAPITSFEGCITTKGSMVQETYPPVCVTKDGLRFVANVPPVEEPIQQIDEDEKAKQCQEQATSTECAEGTVCMANPASVFCKCMGGESLIRSESDPNPGEKGFCVIGGLEYDEWEYFREKAPGENGDTGDNTQSPSQGNEEAKYTLEKSEGSCTIDTQCAWASQGCGGGHGICTNEPDKYKDMVTTCEVDPNFPSNLGYTCGCVESLGKCGWKK